MDVTSRLDWHPLLLDPSGQRSLKPRSAGKTMVIDKGLGLRAFEDLLQTAGDYIDMIKIGFGTSPLYPKNVLQKKIELAKAWDIVIMPGGTFLEVAVSQSAVPSFFETIRQLGFNGIEVSDGTIEMDRVLRNKLILRGVECELNVVTEYGKKAWGSSIEINELIETIHLDAAHGAQLITIEGRESGVGVGIYDEKGECKQNEVDLMLSHIPDKNMIMWETPLKSQQVQLLKTLGPDINLGNIAPDDILSLESLRRGLRSDTLSFGQANVLYK